MSSGDWNQSQFSDKFHAEIASAKSRILWLSDGESPSENRKLERCLFLSLTWYTFKKNLKQNPKAKSIPGSQDFSLN